MVQWTGPYHDAIARSIPLPAESTLDSDPPASHWSLPGKGRVLVIEDDADLREILDLLIGIDGCEAETAPDGLTGLKMATSWAPDLILLDYTLPSMSGAEFVRRYRETPAPHAPILLLTGRDGGRNLARDLGVAGHLPKPFNVEELRAAVAEFVDCSAA